MALHESVPTGACSRKAGRIKSTDHFRIGGFRSVGQLAELGNPLGSKTTHDLLAPDAGRRLARFEALSWVGCEKDRQSFPSAGLSRHAWKRARVLRMALRSTVLDHKPADKGSTFQT
jgi:hypothetical protein